MLPPTVIHNVAAMVENTHLGAPFMDNFSCKICFEVINDPVQCQNNEHYFCRKCIARYLETTEKCPMCIEGLTLETLRPPSRIVVDVISQLKKPLCSHVFRGCTANVGVAELLQHEKTCAYAPVLCSNEGCQETVNRGEKESHETEECKFRKTTCDACHAQMLFVDFEKHQCTLKKEIDEIKTRLDEMSDAIERMATAQEDTLIKLEAHDKSIHNLQNPLRHFSTATITPVNSAKVIKGQIFIFSGKSLEIFNWSTKTWTLVEDGLFFNHLKSFSFIYGKRIMLCDGNSRRIEFLDPNESGLTSTVFPACLPSGNGVLFEDRVITFGCKVQETSLKRPWKSRVLIEKCRDYSSYALQRLGDAIFIISVSGDEIERYDVANNIITSFGILPHRVYDMATAVYKDNIVILGGKRNRASKFLNDVFMYNIHSQECKRLPAMLKKKSSCTAVVMGDVIVAMGGESRQLENQSDCLYLQTVEYYVMGDTTWRRLPNMNLGRAIAAACVYV